MHASDTRQQHEYNNFYSSLFIAIAIAIINSQIMGKGNVTISLHSSHHVAIYI